MCLGGELLLTWCTLHLLVHLWLLFSFDFDGLGIAAFVCCRDLFLVLIGHVGFVFRGTACTCLGKINVAFEIIWHCSGLDHEVTISVNAFDGATIWLDGYFLDQFSNTGLDTDICGLI